MRFLTALLSSILLLAGSVFAFPLLGAAPAAASAAAQADTDGASSGTGTADSTGNGDGADGSGDSSGVSITLDEVTPWVDEDGTLKVRGLIVNSTDQAIADPNLGLAMSTRNLDAEYRIEAWKTDQSQHRMIADLGENGPEARKEAAKAAKDSDDDDKDPVTSVDATFDDSIAPGASYEFTISVPADQLGLPKSSPVSSWGPRGLAVQLADANGLLATGVGFSTWYPSPKFDKTKVSMLAPVTLPGHTADGIIAPDDLDEAIGEGGSLSTIKDLLDHDELGLALDPRVIASFEAAVAEPPPEDEAEQPPSEQPSPEGTDEAATPPPGPEANADGSDEGEESAEEKKAREDQRKRLDDWYQDFLEEARKHTVIALPYGDPDLVGLNEGGLDKLDDFAQDQREIVKDVLPEAKTDIAWPLAGTADRNSLHELQKSGNAAAIIDDLQQPSITGIRDDAHSQTPTTEDGETTIETFVSDSALTQQSAEVIDSKHPAAGVSELVATTAAIQSEAPYRTRHLLLPLPRTAASANWAETIDALSSTPWVDPTGVDELLGTDAEPRGLLQTADDAEGIGAGTLQSLARTRATQARFNSVFTDPEGADTRMDRELLSCTSVAWTLGGSADRCASEAQTGSQQAMDSLYLEKGSSVLLVTGEKTTIPVTIVNDSTAEAKLQIRMKPQTPQLRAQTTETVAVPPAETMRVDVPVEGLANADVPTRIEMVTGDGTVLPKDESLLVRVRADWENIGTAVVGLALAAVFVIGLVKTIRRGRPKIPEEQLADAMARAKNDEPEKR